MQNDLQESEGILPSPHTLLLLVKVEKLSEEPRGKFLANFVNIIDS